MTKIAIYRSQTDKSVTQAHAYSKTHDCSYRYLAYRDLPEIFKKYNVGKKALDYGTGTGYSAHILQNYGLDVIGVDVSKEMLKQAQINYPTIPFYQIEQDIIPIESSTCDLVFSSFVLFEIRTPEKIIDYLLEARRVMKKDGLFLAVTGSQDLHSPSRRWLNFETNFPQNQNLRSGNLVKLYLYDSDIEFTDFYWTENDYRQFIASSGLELLEVSYPLGYKDEPLSWKDEIKFSPFVILTAKIK